MLFGWNVSCSLCRKFRRWYAHLWFRYFFGWFANVFTFTSLVWLLCVLICFCYFHALFDLQGPVLLMPLEAMKMFTERKLFVFFVWLLMDISQLITRSLRAEPEIRFPNLRNPWFNAKAFPFFPISYAILTMVRLSQLLVGHKSHGSILTVWVYFHTNPSYGSFCCRTEHLFAFLILSLSLAHSPTFARIQSHFS